MIKVAGQDVLSIKEIRESFFRDYIVRQARRWLDANNTYLRAPKGLLKKDTVETMDYFKEIVEKLGEQNG